MSPFMLLTVPERVRRHPRVASLHRALTARIMRQAHGASGAWRTTQRLRRLQGGQEASSWGIPFGAMDPEMPSESARTGVPVVDADVPPVRACTRCEGEQHLLDSGRGFGKYRCIVCGVVVGFDLEAEPAEFLLDRGSPGRYTRGLFGSRLLRPEQRLP